VIPAVAIDDSQLATHEPTVGSPPLRDRRSLRTKQSRLTPGPGSARPEK
jgi:hypothetical protein